MAYQPPNDETGDALNLFFSYSHDDEGLRDKIETHISALRRQGLINNWHDRKIRAGAKWEGEISGHLDRADVILLLISADFIDSDYCYGVEMGRALERHETGEARVIPIILREVDWKGMPFAKLNALPTNAKPITSWPNPDEAFKDVATGIRQVVEELLEARRQPDGPASRGSAPGYGGGSVQDTPVQGVSFRGGSSPSPGAFRPTGELLPYLCDRSEQEIALESALRHHRDHMPRRPFIIVVHGDEYECHDMFKERLKVVSLPKLLRIATEQGAIQDCILHRPSSSKQYDPVEVLRRNLYAELLLDDREASLEEVTGALSRNKAPVMVSLHLSYQDWGGAGPRLLDTYLKLWQSFPDLPPMRILGCLFLTYKRLTPLGFLPRWRYGLLNRQIRNYLKGLDFSNYAGLSGVVLPELSAIAQTDAENWFRDKQHFQGLCDVHHPDFCNVQKSIQALRDIYERSAYRTPEGGMPMQPLADELAKLLNNYRCQERR